MAESSLIIRPPRSPDELTEHIKSYVEVAQSFSSDPLPEDMANRLLRRLTTLPGFHQEQVRSAYRNGEQLGGYRIYERLLRVGSARLVTGCIGGVYTRAEVRNQGVATALMHDAIAYAQAHEYSLLLLDGIPKFYHRYGYCDVYDFSTQELDSQAFTQAVFGYAPITRILRQREHSLPLPDDVATVLSILFPTGQIWIPTSDWF